MSVDPSSINSKLIELQTKVQKSTPEIGTFGGRKFSFGGTRSSLNDYVKELNSIINEPGLSKEARNLIGTIVSDIKDLDKRGDDALKGAAWYQKLFTPIRQYWGNRGYKRNVELDRIRNICNVALTSSANPISTSPHPTQQAPSTSAIEANSKKNALLDTLRQRVDVLYRNFYVYRSADSIEYHVKLEIEEMKRLGINPLEKEGLEIWKEFFTIVKNTASYYIKTHNYIGGCDHSTRFITTLIKEQAINPVDNSNELPAFIELLKHFKLLNPQVNIMQSISYYTGIDTTSEKELLILTDIIKALSEEGQQDKAIYDFIVRYKIYGKTEEERKFLRKLSPKNEFNAEDQSLNLPNEVLARIIENADVQSLKSILSTSKDPQIRKLAKIALLGQQRTQSQKLGDVTEFTNTLSFCSIMEDIHTYGKEIQVLDLDFSTMNIPSENVASILQEIAAACPHLEILRLRGIWGYSEINKDICTSLPKSLHTLVVSDCYIKSLEGLPSKIKNLTLQGIRMPDLSESSFVIPESITTLEIKRLFPNKSILSILKLPKTLRVLRCEEVIRSEDNIELPESLEEFSLYGWQGDFKKSLLFFMPKNLKTLAIHGVGFDIGVDDLRACSEHFKNLERLDLSLTIDIKENGIEELPHYIKHLTIIGWDRSFQELMSYAKDMEVLELERPDVEFFADADFSLWPKNLKTLNLYGDLSKEVLTQRIPEHIRNVTVMDWSGTFQELIDHLPVDIETLTLNSNPEIFREVDFQRWPSHLSKLCLYKDCLSKEILKSTKLPETVKEIGILNTGFTFQEVLPFLPNKLEVYEGPFKPEDIPYLPNSLKILKMSDYYFNILSLEDKKRIQDRGIAISMS